MPAGLSYGLTCEITLCGSTKGCLEPCKTSNMERFLLKYLSAFTR